MKPTKLVIRGLNSFCEEETIDLESLSAKGMFGIFGPTGSGKSTVLDAITFALYGRIARESTAKTSAEVINLKSDLARVVFEFQVNGKEEKAYRIIREIKRNKAGGINTSQIRISDISQEELVLAEKEREFNEVIGQIIGLQFDDFVKTVVLPQGGFNEFLKMEGSDRRKVLERLFNLEKYGEDLANKVRKKQSEKQKTLAGIEGELKAYEGLSQAYFKEEKDQISQKREAEKKLKQEKEADAGRLEKIRRSYELKKELDESQALLDLEKAKAPQIEKDQDAILKKQVYDQLDAQIQSYQDQKQKGRELRTRDEAIGKEIDREEKSFEKLLEAFDKAEEAKEKTLPKLIERRARLENSLDSYKDYMGAKDKLTQLKEGLKQIQKEEAKTLEKISLTKEKTEKIQASIQEKKDQIERALSDQSQREDLERAVIVLEKIQDLKLLRRGLEEENKNLLEIGQKLLDEFEKEENRTRLLELNNRLETSKEELISLGFDLERLSTDQGQDQDPREILERLAQRDQHIEGLRKKIKEEEELLKLSLEDLTRLEKEEGERRIEGARKKEEEKNLTQAFEEESQRLIKLLGKVEDPKRQLRLNEEEGQQIEAAYQASKKEKDSLELELRKKKEESAIIKTELKMAIEGMKAIQLQLYARLEELDLCEFSQLEAKEKSIKLEEKMLEIAGWKLSQEERKQKEERIKDHQRLLDETRGKIENLKKQMGDKIILKEDYEAALEENKKINLTYDQLLRDLSAQESKYETDLKRYEQAKKLLEDKVALDQEIELLKELLSVLGARKFVEFMAINQLKYVSGQASKMLEKITEGAYALEVDEQGGFKIRDKKNGGELRSVKNLSGGETFLVSLSLALALSSQIQLKGVAPLELFFLDEGFGTLDDNLLEIVMTALEKVHHDKLTIGLISHLDQLKQRVPIKLILKPAEAGSGGSRTSIEYS